MVFVNEQHYEHQEQSPYEMLGLNEQTVNVKAIRKAYKKMALLLHPDRGGDEEHFKVMKNAYDLLMEEHGGECGGGESDNDHDHDQESTTATTDNDDSSTAADDAHDTDDSSTASTTDDDPSTAGAEKDEEDDYSSSSFSAHGASSPKDTMPTGSFSPDEAEAASNDANSSTAKNHPTMHTAAAANDDAANADAANDTSTTTTTGPPMPQRTKTTPAEADNSSWPEPMVVATSTTTTTDDSLSSTEGNDDDDSSSGDENPDDNHHYHGADIGNGSNHANNIAFSRIIYGLRKSDGMPCLRCMQQGKFCFQHTDQDPQNAGKPKVFGFTQQGNPCKRCIKQGKFCYQHVGQNNKN